MKRILTILLVVPVLMLPALSHAQTISTNNSVHYQDANEITSYLHDIRKHRPVSVHRQSRKVGVEKYYDRDPNPNAPKRSDFKSRRYSSVANF